MKIQVLTAILATAMIGLGLGLADDEKEATPKPKEGQEAAAKAIEGAWELEMAGGAKRHKLIAGGRWAITQCDPDSGVVIFHHGGTYTFDGKNYVEKVEYASENTVEMIGLIHKFEVTIKGDTLHQVGVGNPFTEDWTRLKPGGKAAK